MKGESIKKFKALRYLRDINNHYDIKQKIGNYGHVNRAYAKKFKEDIVLKQINKYDLVSDRR